MSGRSTGRNTANRLVHADRAAQIPASGPEPGLLRTNQERPERSWRDHRAHLRCAASMPRIVAISQEHAGSAAGHRIERGLCPAPCGWIGRRQAQSPPLPNEAGSTARLLHESDQRANPQFEVLQLELLIRRVDVVVGKPKAHHHARQPKVPVEIADDRNRAAGADEDRVLAPDLVQRMRRRLDVFVVDRNETCIARVDQPDINIDTLRARSSPRSSCIARRPSRASCSGPGASRPWQAPLQGSPSSRRLP